MELPAQALHPIYSSESILVCPHDLFNVVGEDADVAAGVYLDEDAPCYDSIASVGSAGSDD